MVVAVVGQLIDVEGPRPADN